MLKPLFFGVACVALCLGIGPGHAAEQAESAATSPASSIEGPTAVAEIAEDRSRDLDRVIGRVDAMDDAVSSAARASEAAGRNADLVIKVIGALGGLVLLGIAVLGFLGYRRFQSLLGAVREARDEGQKLLDEVRECLGEARKTQGHIEQYGKQAEARVKELGSLAVDPEASEEQRRALAELGERLELVEALGLPVDAAALVARGNAHYNNGDYANAIRWYERAVEREPTNHVALSNWGSALGECARLKEGAEAERLLGQACEKYEAAVEMKPEDGALLNQWSAALLLRGTRKGGAEAKALFEQAKEKALGADSAEPGTGAYNAACACARMGEEEECRKWLERRRDTSGLPSRKHMEEDEDLESVRGTGWFKEILEAATE